MASTEQGGSANPYRMNRVELDPALYDPAPESLDFLHETITADNVELKGIIFDVQQK